MISVVMVMVVRVLLIRVSVIVSFFLLISVMCSMILILVGIKSRDRFDRNVFLMVVRLLGILWLIIRLVKSSIILIIGLGMGSLVEIEISFFISWYVKIIVR